MYKLENKKVHIYIVIRAFILLITIIYSITYIFYVSDSIL